MVHFTHLSPNILIPSCELALPESLHSNIEPISPFSQVTLTPHRKSWRYKKGEPSFGDQNLEHNFENSMQKIIVQLAPNSNTRSAKSRKFATPQPGEQRSTIRGILMTIYSENRKYPWFFRHIPEIAQLRKKKKIRSLIYFFLLSMRTMTGVCLQRLGGGVLFRSLIQSLSSVTFLINIFSFFPLAF